MKPMQVIDEASTHRILADLAAERGIPREDLEAEIEQMKSDTSGEEHLTFEEALETGSLRPERQTHWKSCLYCKELVRTLPPEPEEVEKFLKNAQRPSWYKRPAAAALAFSLLALFVLKPMLRAIGTSSSEATDPEPMTAPKG